MAERRRVLVLGGGISGLSTAMELVGDADVTIVERRSLVGGKSRTYIDPDFEVFREHSFRVFHRTYANLFDAMRRIPFRDGRTVFDNLEPFVEERELFENYPKTWEQYASRRPPLDWRERFLIARDLGALARVLASSDRRLREEYGSRDFEEVFAARADGTRGLVFDVLRGMSQVEYSADRLNPDVRVMRSFIEKHFLHGPPGTGWFALRGPTSDAFLEPMRTHLAASGVRFRLGAEVVSIDYDAERRRVASVHVRDVGSGKVDEVEADLVVSALTSDVLVPMLSPALLRDAPSLAALADVRRVGNNGVLIYTNAVQEIGGGYHLWHPWRPAVTAYARRWDPAIRDLATMGRGAVRGEIRDILSYCLCDWEEPGVRVQKPAKACSPDEIYEELCHTAESDRSVVRNFDRATHVRPVDRTGRSVACLVDDALVYDPTGRFVVRNEDTLLHLPAGGFDRMPHAATGVPNFVLASTHAWNAFACGDSMESANETGRRAANVVLERLGSPRRVPVFEGRMDGPVLRALAAIRAVDAKLSDALRSLGAHRA